MDEHFIFLPWGWFRDPTTNVNRALVTEGYYSRNEFVELMRRFSDRADVIQWLADMLEE